MRASEQKGGKIARLRRANLSICMRDIGRDFFVAS